MGDEKQKFDPSAEYSTEKPAFNPDASYDSSNPVAEIRAYHGDVKESPGLAYSRGYAAPDQTHKFSGNFFDRASSQFSQDLQDPKNFIPDWHMLLGAPGMAYQGLKNAYEMYQHRNDPQPDSAESVGHMGIPLLTALVTHSADASGVEPPVERIPIWKREGMNTEGTPVPSILNREPTSSGPGRTTFPQAPQPKVPKAPRPEPMWKAAPSEGMAVPSVLDREPISSGPGRSTFPVEKSAPPARPPRPAPLWKTNPSEGTDVPSIINQQPFAQDAKPRPMMAPEPQGMKVPTSPQDYSAPLQTELEKGLGAKRIQSGVKMRDQLGTDAEPHQDDLSGYTPVKGSSIITAYKTDPSAGELTVKFNNGSHHVYAPLSADDLAAFDASESKGKAFQNLKDNHMYKIVDGKRIPVKGASRSAAPTGEGVLRNDQ